MVDTSEYKDLLMRIQIRKQKPRRDFKNIKLGTVSFNSAVLDVPILDDEVIAFANEYVKSGDMNGLILNVQNTVQLSPEKISKLHDGINFRVAGQFDDEQFQDDWDTAFYDKKRNKESGFELYFLSQIYTKKEMLSILKALKTLEKGTENLRKLQTAKVLYDNACKYFVYDDGYTQKPSSETRSLRSLISRHGVCAGFSIIYKELCERNGIECRYVEGVYDEFPENEFTPHAWNLVTIDGKSYVVDVAMGLLRSCGTKSFRTFALNKNLAREYQPNEDDYNVNYCYPKFGWRVALDKTIYKRKDLPVQHAKKYGKRIDKILTQNELMQMYTDGFFDKFCSGVQIPQTEPSPEAGQ